MSNDGIIPVKGKLYTKVVNNVLFLTLPITILMTFTNEGALNRIQPHKIKLVL